MTKLGTIAFKGKMEHKYEFSIFPMDAHFKEGHGAVYIITKRHDEPNHHHGHHVIYIGTSTDMSSEMSDHPEQALFSSEGANCICVHASQDDSARNRIAQELTDRYLTN